jgi:hypothetical protein
VSDHSDTGDMSSNEVRRYCYCCDGVRLCLCGSEHLTGPLPNPQMIHEWIWSSGGMIDIDSGKPKDWEKIVSQWLFVHQKFHMDWPAQETLAYAVRSRRPTTWAMAQPRWEDNHELPFRGWFWWRLSWPPSSYHIGIRRRDWEKPWEGLIHDSL